MSPRSRHPTPQAQNGHRTAELRSLAFHRLVAERLDTNLLDRARARVAGWLTGDGPVDHRWAEKWQELLDLPITEIKRRLSEDSEQMRDLRQSTPFAGVLSETERRRILREVR